MGKTHGILLAILGLWIATSIGNAAAAAEVGHNTPGLHPLGLLFGISVAAVGYIAGNRIGQND